MSWNPFKPKPISSDDGGRADLARRQGEADRAARQRSEEAEGRRVTRDWEARIWELRARCSRGPDNEAHDNCYGH